MGTAPTPPVPLDNEPTTNARLSHLWKACPTMTAWDFGLFPTLVSNVSANTGVQSTCLSSTFFLLKTQLGVKLLDHYGDAIFNVSRVAKLFHTAAVSFFTATARFHHQLLHQQLTRVLTWPNPPQHLGVLFFNNSHANECGAAPPCGLDLHLFNAWWCCASFHMLIGHLYLFWGKWAIQWPINTCPLPTF